MHIPNLSVQVLFLHFCTLPIQDLSNEKQSSAASLWLRFPEVCCFPMFPSCTLFASHASSHQLWGALPCHLFWDELAVCCPSPSFLLWKEFFFFKCSPQPNEQCGCMFLFKPTSSASRHALAWHCFSTLEQQLGLAEKELSSKCFVSVCCWHVIKGQARKWVASCDFVFCLWLPGRCLCVKHPSWSLLLRESFLSSRVSVLLTVHVCKLVWFDRKSLT